MAYAWEVTPEKVKEAVQKIIQISKPRKVILFGSYVRGNAGINSDLDVLVITGYDVENPRKESVRIRRELSDIRMAMDIVVVPEDIFRELSDVPGLVYREAVRSGRVVYESED